MLTSDGRKEVVTLVLPFPQQKLHAVTGKHDQHSHDGFAHGEPTKHDIESCLLNHVISHARTFILQLILRSTHMAFMSDNEGNFSFFAMYSYSTEYNGSMYGAAKDLILSVGELHRVLACQACLRGVACTHHSSITSSSMEAWEMFRNACTSVRGIHHHIDHWSSPAHVQN